MELKSQISIWKKSDLRFLRNTYQVTRGITYIIAVVFLSLQFFLQIASTVMVKPLMNDFNISELGISSLSATLFYGYIFWLIPAGFMLDYLGSKKSILFACLALGFGSLIFGYSHNISVAVVGRFMMGMGSSYAFINLLYITNLHFSLKNFAFLAGLGEAFSILTASICAMTLPLWISKYGWRFIIILSGWFSLILFIIAILLFENNYKIKKNSHINWQIITQLFLRLARDKQLWLLGMYGLCVFSLITVFSSLWGTPFITNVYHYDIRNATTAVMMVPLGIGAGCLCIGFAARVFSNKQIMLVASIICALLMSMIIYIPGIKFISLLLLLFFCGFFSATYIQVYSVAQKSYAVEIHGSIMSIITIIIMGGAPVLQILLGWLLHTKFFNMTDNVMLSFRLSFLIIPLCLIIAFIIALRLNKK